MEPLVASSAAHVVRPALHGTQSDLAALLREGRVLAGEILRGGGDGSVLLAIGRHRVPAQTNLNLDPGQSFLFRVHMEGGEVVLHVLGAGDPEAAGLLRALRSVVGERRPVGELLGALAARLRGELSGGAGDSRLRSLLGQLEAHVFRPGQHGGADLARLLASSGLRYEASLAAALAGGGAAAAVQRAGSDLKGELLRALRELSEGGLSEALSRALAGLEAEQLVNLARQRAGEPWVWSLPVPDGEGWTTARLIVPDERGSRDAEDGGEHAEELRLVVGVSFSGTGPVRAELALSPERLTVRLVVLRPEVADRLGRDFADLAERLSSKGRRVHLFARVGTPAEVEVAQRPLDVRFLREHRLMDVSG